MVSFLKKISKEEGDLSTPVSRYNTNWLPRGKANLRLLVKYVEKMFQSVTQSTDVCRIWRFIWTAGSINCGLQFRRMNRTTQLPLQHLSARPNKCFHACSFWRTKAFCCVCGNTTISLANQWNPLGNTKQHIESKVCKACKAKRQGSSTVSSKDISTKKKWQESNAQAPSKPSLCHGFYCEDYTLTVKGENIQTKPKLLLNDSKPGTDEGKQLWYPELSTRLRVLTLQVASQQKLGELFAVHNANVFLVSLSALNVF